MSKTRPAQQPLQTVTRLNEGLTIMTEFSYHTVNNKRLPCNKNCDGCFFSRKLIYQLPLMLTKEVWERHRYTFQDIHRTIKRINQAKPLWCLGQIEQLSCSKSSSKSSYAPPGGTAIGNAKKDQFIFGGRKLVFSKLMAAFQDNLEFAHQNTRSVLINPDDSENPPLPVHRVLPETYKGLLVSLPRESEYQENYVKRNERRKYETYYRWKNIMCVPRCLQENGLILMDRIVTQQVYEEAFAYHKSLNNVQCFTLVPATVEIAGQCYVVTDEAWYAAHEKFRGKVIDDDEDESV